MGEEDAGEDEGGTITTAAKRQGRALQFFGTEDGMF
jgi:hypothetical protein